MALGEVRGTNQMPVLVYAGEFGADPCSGAEPDILATGTVELRVMANFAEDGSGHVSQLAHGLVNYSTGGTGRFTGRLGLYFGPGGQFLGAIGDIILTPHPEAT